MLRLWNKTGITVKNWRSRAWSIDPKVTNLIIIKTEPAKNIERLDTANTNLNFNLDFPKLLKNYPQYFDALANMEQFDQ